MSKTSYSVKQFFEFTKNSPEVALSIFALALLGYLVYAASSAKPQEASGFIALVLLCIVVAVTAFGIIKIAFTYWERN